MLKVNRLRLFRVWALFYKIMTKRAELLLSPTDDLVKKHKFFSIPRRNEFRLSATGPIFLIFGAAGESMTKISNFFIGETVIYVRPTRRGAYTAETERLLRRIGPRAQFVCATLEAVNALRARAPDLAECANLALLSPLCTVMAPKGVEGLWLRPVREVELAGAATQIATDPAPQVDLEAIFARPWARAAEAPSMVLAGSSYAGLRAQMDDRVREHAAPRGEGVRMMASPLALDGLARRPAELPALSWRALWYSSDSPRVEAGDEVLDSVLALGGFPAGEAEEPARRARALALVRHSLERTRFIAVGSKRLISREQAFARLGLLGQTQSDVADLVAGLLEIGAINAVGARILGDDLEAHALSVEGRAVARAALRGEAMLSVPRLTRRVDLLDDFLDFVATRLEPIDRPATILLRFRVAGDAAAAVEELYELIRDQGADRDLLAEIAERFAATPDLLVRLAARLTREGANRTTLAVLEIAAAAPEARADLLSLVAERQLELGLLPQALGTARRLSAVAPDDPEAVRLRLAAGDAAETPQEAAADMLVAAECAYLAGQTDVAVQLARRALARADARLSPMVESALTNFLLAQNQASQAVEIAQARLYASAPRVRDTAALALAELYGFIGDGSAARTALRAAEQLGSAVAATRLRALLVRSGSIDQEIETYARTYAKDKSLPRLRHFMSMLEIAGRIDELNALAAEAKRDGVGRKEDVDFALAEILARTGRLREALGVLAPLQVLRSHRLQALALFAGCCRGLGDLDGARAAWTLALETGQGRQTAQIALGEIAERSGLYAEAAERYSEVLRVAPLSRVATSWASALRISRALPSVRAGLERVAATTPEAGVCYWLSAIEAEEGRLDLAIERAREASALEPLNINLARHLIELLVLDADYPAAREVVAQLEPMVQMRAQRLADVADLWRGLGESQRAADSVKRALKLAPRNAAVLMTAARIAFEHEEFETARGWACAALDVDPARMGSYLLAARIARRLGLAEEASALVRTVAAVGSNRSLALSAAVEDAVFCRDAASAIARLDALEAMRHAAGQKPQLRLIWAVAGLAGEAGDHAAFMRFAGMMVEAIVSVLPPDLGLWRGASFAGQRMLSIARGGPGDDVRFYYAVLRGAAAEASHLTHVGDPRLESLFRRNFPGADFVPNPWAGRRLGRRRAAITDEIRSVAAGTMEALRRFGTYLPQRKVGEADHIAIADALTLRRLFPTFGASRAGPAPAPMTCDPDKLAQVRAFLDALPPGPRVGVSWRPSYASANRFTGGFFHVEETAPFLSVEGVIFVDLHPNLVEEEFARAREIAGGRLHRGPFDLQDDFEALAALVASLDAVITPGVTQRDFAGAFRYRDVWSFNLAPEYSERWRVDEAGRDRLQPVIIHHDHVTNGDRGAIAQALAARVRALALEGARAGRLRAGVI